METQESSVVCGHIPEPLSSSLPTIPGSLDLSGLSPLCPMHRHRDCETPDLWTRTDPCDGPRMFSLAWLPALGTPLPCQSRPAYMGRWARTGHDLESLPEAKGVRSEAGGLEGSQLCIHTPFTARIVIPISWCVSLCDLLASYYPPNL